MISDYLTSARTRFEYYKSLGEKTIAQLSDEQLFWQCNEESNSIGTIVKHLNGNMLSRWTDFLHSDGEKEWRKRDAEFENDIKSGEELMSLWNKGWQCLFTALDSLKPGDLSREIYIRHESYSAMDAINRQLAHYAYHVGQIVFIGKMVCNERWTSLTIPRGKSNEFNAKKLAESDSKFAKK
jgi:Protein of unknown function (DUF1572)